MGIQTHDPRGLLANGKQEAVKTTFQEPATAEHMPMLLTLC